MNPDKNAIEAVKQGDRDRFAELVERHKRMVYAIAWSYLGDAEICEDAAQETFIRAFRYLGALRDLERFPAWISRDRAQCERHTAAPAPDRTGESKTMADRATRLGHHPSKH